MIIKFDKEYNYYNLISKLFLDRIKQYINKI